MIFENLANMKYKYGTSTFWARGYYVNTIGLNKATVKKYIQNQGQEDMIEDERTIKEYNNPFKGS